MLAVVIFLFDNLREKRSVPLTSQVSHILKILVAHQLKITGLECFACYLAPKLSLKGQLNTLDLYPHIIPPPGTSC